jgi:hypothetical protein
MAVPSLRHYDDIYGTGRAAILILSVSPRFLCIFCVQLEFPSSVIKGLF